MQRAAAGQGGQGGQGGEGWPRRRQAPARPAKGAAGPESRCSRRRATCGSKTRPTPTASKARRSRNWKKPCKRSKSGSRSFAKRRSSRSSPASKPASARCSRAEATLGHTAVFEKKRGRQQRRILRADRNTVRGIGDDERRMSPVINPETKVLDEQTARRPGPAGPRDHHRRRHERRLSRCGRTGSRRPARRSATARADDVGPTLTRNTLQKEIETTLEELIEALQQAQQQKEGAGGGGGGGGGETAPVAELGRTEAAAGGSIADQSPHGGVETTRPKEAPARRNPEKRS